MESLRTTWFIKGPVNQLQVALARMRDPTWKTYQRPNEKSINQSMDTDFYSVTHKARTEALDGA